MVKGHEPSLGARADQMANQVLLQELTNIGVVPVLRAKSSDRVLRAVQALIEGGIPVAEVTLTVPGASEVIRRCGEEFGPRCIVGAGTVTDVKGCAEAIDAGSQFVVTPAVKPDIFKLCKARHVCVIGGALTPTEVLAAWGGGADAVKVFPAKSVGGPSYIRMLHEPFPDIPLVPTGGVSLETLGDYLRAGAIFVGAGGDLANREAIEAGRADTIRERARLYREAVRSCRAAAT